MNSILNQKAQHESTLLQHAGHEHRVGQGLISATESAVTFQTERHEDIPVYSRMSNTKNHSELHTLLAAIEATEDALSFGSGMAALSTVFLTFLRPGDHVVVLENCYGTTQTFFKKVCANLGIEHTFASIENWEKPIRPNTKLMHCESISNPFCIPIDIRKVVQSARAKKILTVCDNTFASPINLKPAALGIDLVVESGTKYMNGHSDVVCGSVAGSKKLIAEVYEYAKVLGGFLPNREVAMLLRGLRTMELRVERHNHNGSEFAKRLSALPEVEKVFYGSESSAKEIFKRGYSGMCAVRFRKSVNLQKLIRSTKIMRDVPSLGGTETTCTMPFFTTHYAMKEEEKVALGIDQSLLRISVGLENIDDLIADLKSALKSI